MQANSAEHQPIDASKSILGVTSGFIDSTSSAVEDAAHLGSDPTHFHGYFSSCMEMYADAQTVAKYLDAHRDWFRRCAQPMKVDPIGDNGYALTIGRFGSFGYDVEPKIGLDLLPQDEGVYRIKTIPIPGYEPPGYEVDFQAALQLVETELEAAQANSSTTVLTRVEWELNLTVSLQFPRFIHALPKSLIQSTGDRLLNQIVRQVSRRLTHKVQQDFHSVLELPVPKKRKKHLWDRNADCAHLDAE
jgi:hypothetical protein